MNMNEILSNFNSDQLQKINEILNSQQGKSLQHRLNNADKSKLLEQFRRLDSSDVNSFLTNLTKEEILRMLR